MSKAVVIDYQALGMEVRTTCEHIGEQLEKALKEIRTTLDDASLLVDDSMNTHEALVTKKAEHLKEEVISLLSQVETFEHTEIKRVNNHSRVYKDYLAFQQDIQSRAASALQRTTKIMTHDVYALRTMIDEAFIERSKTIRQRLISPGNAIDLAFSNKLAAVEDVLLRDAIYRLALLPEHRTLTFDEFVSRAKQSLEDEIAGCLVENKDDITNGIKREMVENHVAPEAIESITSIETVEEIRKQASKAIIGERVRKETLKAVIAAIRARGFIVSNENIRLDRSTDQVILVAKKASGQRAQFKIHIDGRFIYAFDGYEGQACQEDIEPFMEDLETVYGMKMTERDVIWENPDKISTMRYQSQKTGKSGQ